MTETFPLNLIQTNNPSVWTQQMGEKTVKSKCTEAA